MSGTPDSKILEDLVAQIEVSGNYRVLRRLVPRKIFGARSGGQAKIGIALDIETTGLDIERDEIIEIGMIKFEYLMDGQMVRVLDEFSGVHEPSVPIPIEVTRLTGIEIEHVRGKRISEDEVSRFAQDAVLIIAHNAAFDRPFCERLSPEFCNKAWACSMSEVDWTAEGFEGRSLNALLTGYRLFHDGHRALEDCRALLEILSRLLPITKQLVLDELLKSARSDTIRIWAEGAPFEKKDVLKSRGYRWADGADGGRRAWWIEIPEKFIQSEIEFLRSSIGPSEANFPYQRRTAFNRFSTRALPT